MARRPSVLSIQVDETPSSIAKKDAFSVSESGTFEGGNFAITSQGITSREGNLSSRGDSHNYHGGLVQVADLERKESLGQGSSAVVYKAIHKPTNRVLALKEINVFEEVKRQQILKELEALYESTSRHLVEFYGAFYAEGSILIALELMDGGSLFDIYRGCGPITEPILSKICRQVLKGLYYLHKKRHMIHRDIKPSNILMNSSGNFKITDFGVSAGLDSTMANAQTFVGTVTYMSPERLIGLRYSANCDIWSLGLTVIECSLAQFPFTNPENGSRTFGFWELLNHIKTQPPPSLPRDRFSEEICDFVDLCLKSKDERPSAQALLKHPFITKYKKGDFGYTQWVKNVLQTQADLRQSKPDNAKAEEKAVSDLLNGISF